MTVRNASSPLVAYAALAFLIAVSSAHAGNTSTNTSNNSSTNTSSDRSSSSSSSNSSSNSSSSRGRVDDNRRDERIDERGDGRFMDFRYDLFESYRSERGRWSCDYSEGKYAEREDHEDDD